jgi:hypothetical protein
MSSQGSSTATSISRAFAGEAAMDGTPRADEAASRKRNADEDADVHDVAWLDTWLLGSERFGMCASSVAAATLKRLQVRCPRLIFHLGPAVCQQFRILVMPRANVHLTLRCMRARYIPVCAARMPEALSSSTKSIHAFRALCLHYTRQLLLLLLIFLLICLNASSLCAFSAAHDADMHSLTYRGTGSSGYVQPE